MGTVCDVMPLTGLNRAFVTQGLKIIKQHLNVGIKTLINMANIDEEINVYHLGFILGPRLNSTGRVGESMVSSHLLCVSDEFEALQIAKNLEVYNKERQKLENIMLNEAIAIIEKKKLNDSNVIFLENDEWHEGIIGIMASRLKDKFEKPVFIASKIHDHYKTSCRSVRGVDVGSVILEAGLKRLIIDGGGHAMAGGFNFELDRLEEIKQFLFDKLNDSASHFIHNKEKNIDLILECKSLTLNLAREIEKLGPFGVGNSKPKIVLKNIVIVRSDVVGKNQDCIRLLVCDKDGVKTSKGIQAMCFRTKKDDKIYSSLSKGKNVDLLGELNINKWLGHETVQFVVEDVL
jgi:single-stranded-DNA-specific exonuclease